MPPVCETPEALEAIAAGFAAGTGPVALDAERASGHRYGQRAFLIQAKRAGSGICLLDPEAVDLAPFAAAIQQEEWILHSATQDLPCLSEAGLRPQRLFDTELAARLLGLPRVGLAALTESQLGWRLAKGHGAADWSIRPLPHDYLRYAALDVELLIELRDLLQQQLVEAGKWEWAQQEFAALVEWTPHRHPDPWRRTSGSHRLRRPRNLAALRALWQARDSLAERLDLAPGRVLPDAALVAAAEAPPASRSALLELPGFKRQQRRLTIWWDALRSVRELDDSELPPSRVPGDGPPHPRSWGSRDAAAAARFTSARGVVVGLAERHEMPPEVLISPDAVRRLAWSPPDPVTPASVGEFLRGRGARDWQADLLAEDLATALLDAAP